MSGADQSYEIGSDSGDSFDADVSGESSSEPGGGDVEVTCSSVTVLPTDAVDTAFPSFAEQAEPNSARAQTDAKIARYFIVKGKVQGRLKFFYLCVT